MARLRLIVCAAVVMAFAGMARGDWSEVSSEQLVEAADQSIIRHEWTSTATDSTPYDISACLGAVEARFDPSTGDGSTDATVDFMLCRNSTDTWQRCRSQGFPGPSDGTTWVPLNALTEGENFILANALTATSGGDTARAEIRCTGSKGLAENTGSGVGDDLGDHTATEDLEMAGNSILEAAKVNDSDYYVSGYGSISAAITACEATTGGTVIVDEAVSIDLDGVTSPGLTLTKCSIQGRGPLRHVDASPFISGMPIITLLNFDTMVADGDSEKKGILANGGAIVIENIGILTDDEDSATQVLAIGDGTAIRRGTTVRDVIIAGSTATGDGIGIELDDAVETRIENVHVKQFAEAIRFSGDSTTATVIASSFRKSDVGIHFNQTASTAAFPHYFIDVIAEANVGAMLASANVANVIMLDNFYIEYESATGTDSTRYGIKNESIGAVFFIDGLTIFPNTNLMDSARDFWQTSTTFAGFAPHVIEGARFVHGITIADADQNQVILKNMRTLRDVSAVAYSVFPSDGRVVSEQVFYDDNGCQTAMVTLNQAVWGAKCYQGSTSTVYECSDPDNASGANDGICDHVDEITLLDDTNRAANYAWTGEHDFGGGSLEIPNSTTLPATCTVGQGYMDTNATSGQRFYLCESTNTWALQGDGGGGGGDDILANGVDIALANLLNSGDINVFYCDDVDDPHPDCAATGDVVFDIPTGGVNTTEILDGTVAAVDVASDVATQAELDAKSASSAGADGDVMRADGTSGDVQGSGCNIDDSGNLVCDGSISGGDPGDNDRAYETPVNSTSLGTPASSQCRLGFVGASVAAGALYLHCEGSSLTKVPALAAAETITGNWVNTANPWADNEVSDTITVGSGGSVDSAAIGSEVRSMNFGGASLSADGTQCANPTEVTINSGPKLWTAICADNDGSTLYGSTTMPDGWDGGTVTFEHAYIQTAADTGVLNGDIAAQCRGNGEVPSSTWGTEVAIDDAAVVGSNSNDHTTSAAVTPAGTCAGGDTIYWRYQLDATGTTTAVATLHHIGFKMEYTTGVGD